MNDKARDILKTAGWQQACSEHGAQMRSDIKKDGALEADVVSWNGERLTIDSEIFDAKGIARLVFIVCVFSPDLGVLCSKIDNEDAELERALTVYRERTKNLGRPSFHPFKTNVPVERTKSGCLAL